MRGDITLGEVKALCAELTGKYGPDNCCHHCDFEKLGCCDPPDTWNVDELHRELTEQTDGGLRVSIEQLEEENKRLRIIVGAVETMLGRKFEVGV